MLSLIDDGLLHDIDAALNGQNTVLKVTADVLEIFTTVEKVKKRAERRSRGALAEPFAKKRVK